MDIKGTAQEVQYEFPYHYIPQYQNQNFKPFRLFGSGYEYIGYIHFVINKIESLTFDSLLDVGCGDGRLLHELYKIFPEKKLNGADTSQRAITFAKTITPEVNFTCGDITDPKLFDQPFDVITLIETLEHIPPEFIPQFVKGLHQHLKNDGYLLLTVPSINHKPVEKHYQHFDHTLIGKNLKPYFEITEHFYINKNCFWNKWLKKMIKNDFFVLNHQTTLNWLYRLYSKNWLSACPRTGKRVCVFAKKQALS